LSRKNPVGIPYKVKLILTFSLHLNSAQARLSFSWPPTKAHPALRLPHPNKTSHPPGGLAPSIQNPSLPFSPPPFHGRRPYASAPFRRRPLARGFPTLGSRHPGPSVVSSPPRHPLPQLTQGRLLSVPVSLPSPPGPIDPGLWYSAASCSFHFRRVMLRSVYHGRALCISKRHLGKARKEKDARDWTYSCVMFMSHGCLDSGVLIF
jgi:hypothetical protein